MISTLNDARPMQTAGRRRKTTRDQEIAARYRDGARAAHLARDYGITVPRIRQILKEHGAVKPDNAAVVLRANCFLRSIGREHLKAVGRARLQVAQGWTVDPATRLMLAELYEALDRLLEEES